MKNQNRAYLFAIIAVLFWSTVASAFKISLRYLDFLQLQFYATLVSVVILFVIVSFQDKLCLLKEYTFKDYFHSAVLGFLNPFLYYLVLLKAYSLLLAQEAQCLNYIWGITLVILSVPLLKQKISAKALGAILLSFFGVLIIATRGDFSTFSFSNPLGVCLAVGSSVIWSLYWIYNMKDKRDTETKLFLNFFFGLIFITIANILFSKIIFPDFKGIIGIIYIGLFEMGITFIIWLKALSLSKTTAKVSNLIFLAPFLSLFIISKIVKERILLSSIIGLFFIISGIIIQNFKLKKLL
ncbi:MAG: DMT family transporter [Armatimonadetes bacterium]|nr:DMT family transporter [Armatimonadota bacterium]